MRSTAPRSSMPAVATKPSIRGPQNQASSAAEEKTGPVVDVPQAEQIIREAMDYQKLGLSSLEVPRRDLDNTFLRIEEMARGSTKPLRDDPSARFGAGRRQEPKAVLRLSACAEAGGEIVGYILELWMITFGMKPEDDWAPIVIEDMRLKQVAEALKSRESGKARKD